MSSPEVERFEMSDYDYNQILDPTAARGRRQTKNQATYGVWAESDDSDDGKPGFGSSRRQKGQGQSSGFSSGISFISGGMKDDAKSDKGSQRQDDNEGWIHKKRKSSGKEQAPMPRYVKGHNKDVDREFGGWERYTKGIGQKLLAKMGHKPGEGLGKTGQGITTPVEAVVRKGRGAVGIHGSERSQRSLKDFPVKDEEEEEDKEFQKQLSQWKKQPEKKQKPKYIYKTAQEVLDMGGKKRKPVVDTGPKVKVIDMTGKEQRVLSGYHAIGKSHDRPDDEEDLVEDSNSEAQQQQQEKPQVFSMPELMHNLNLLVDMAEEDIVLNDRRLRHGSDRLVTLHHEDERLSEVLQQEEAQLSRLQAVVDLVVSCEERLRPESRDPLTLDSCAEIFKMLQTEYYEEYKLYDLPSLGVALLFPLMRTFFTGWLPLRDPEFGLLTVSEWREILGGDEGTISNTSSRSASDGGMDVYQHLIWDIWLPPVRATILKWNVRDTDALTHLLESWRPALPSWVLENILDQLVLPRLLQEVEAWDPLTDTTPIHCWLHPWLPLMGDKLEPLYAPIRHKIANALTNWHPSDASAKIILEPWHGVFRPGHMTAFLVKNILPKLELEIRGMAINPHQQFLDPWRWVMAWKDMLPIAAMVNMLEVSFFPKWHQVLLAWLSNMPNYQDVTKWYLGWKAQFPENLLGYPTIKDQFNKALETMNRAVSGTLMPGVKENMAYFTHAERRIMDSKAPPTANIKDSRNETGSPGPGPARAGLGVPTTFKDLVERRAEQEDLLYIPLSGKTQEGKQVYRFGKTTIYYDHNVVFMQEQSSGRWLPTSLNALIEAAR